MRSSQDCATQNEDIMQTRCQLHSDLAMPHHVYCNLRCRKSPEPSSAQQRSTSAPPDPWLKPSSTFKSSIKIPCVYSRGMYRYQRPWSCNSLWLPSQLEAWRTYFRLDRVFKPRLYSGYNSCLLYDEDLGILKTRIRTYLDPAHRSRAYRAQQRKRKEIVLNDFLVDWWFSSGYACSHLLLSKIDHASYFTDCVPSSPMGITGAIGFVSTRLRISNTVYWVTGDARVRFAGSVFLSFCVVFWLKRLSPRMHTHGMISWTHLDFEGSSPSAWEMHGL